MKHNKLALGIDIGGTKIAFALVDRQGAWSHWLQAQARQRMQKFYFKVC